MHFKSYLNVVVVKSDPQKPLPKHREEHYFDWREGAMNTELLQRHLLNYSELDTGVEWKPNVAKILIVRYTRAQLVENIALHKGKAGTLAPTFLKSTQPEQAGGTEIVAEGKNFTEIWSKVYKYLSEVEKPALLFGFDIIPFDLRLILTSLKQANLDAKTIPDNVFFTDSFLALMAAEKKHHSEIGAKGKWNDYSAKIASKCPEGLLLRLGKYFAQHNAGRKELVVDASQKYFSNRDNFALAKIYPTLFPGEPFVERNESVQTYAREQKRVAACYGTEFIDYMENCNASFQPVLTELFEMED